MVLVSVMYPNQPGSRFDERHYLDQHAALAMQCWERMGLRQVSLLRGVGTPGGGSCESMHQ